MLLDGASDFHSLLRSRWSDDLDRLENTRFAYHRERIDAELSRRLADLPPAGQPVFAQVDHGFHNLFVDRDRRENTAVLVWESLYALAPTYDLALVVHEIACGFSLALSEFLDRRDLVRFGLSEGYRAVRPLPGTLVRRRTCYQLGLLLALQTSLEADLPGRGVPADRLDEAAAGMRVLVERALE